MDTPKTTTEPSHAWFHRNEEKAKKLKLQIPVHANRFFGLISADYKGKDFVIIPEFILFRRVTNPPGIVHVCRAADLTKTDYLGVSRYSSLVSAEIAIGNPNVTREETLYDAAWDITALLKLLGHSHITGPASTTCSWDVIAAVNDNSLDFRLHDDISKQLVFSPKKPITEQDLDWIKKHMTNTADLQNAERSQRLSLAFNIAYHWNHTADSRVAISNIWSGLEALFGIQNDRPVTRKLAERIHNWLPQFVSVEKVCELYNHRCDAIHGRTIKSEEFKIAMEESLALLQKSLIKCIEQNKKTLPDWNG